MNTTTKTTGSLEAAKKHIPFVALTASDLLKGSSPLPDYLLSPWLREGQNAMVYADTGVGKTWFALTLAWVLAGGGEIAGWRTDKPRRVLYVDGEMPTWSLEERIKVIAEGYRDTIYPPVAAANILFVPRLAQKTTKGTKAPVWVDLASDAGQKLIAEMIEEARPDVVIFDNFTTLTDSLKDENDATAFKAAIGNLLGAKAQGVTTILIHHSNKGGNSYRGSSAIAATFDAIVHLKKPKDAKVYEADFSVVFEKNRNRGDASVQQNRWSLGESGQWAVTVDEDAKLAEIVEGLRSGKHSTQRELGLALDLKDYQVTRLIKRAEASGLLKRGEAKTLLEAAKDGTEEETVVKRLKGASDF
ncbi:AAA family ATPase [Vineibacter terrae]|uniref:AAA family ATPase n=1 Tax=Vineibacter terrae TaxID=2586908 RepID=A0A5C8PBW0_9HYPH|nr:AAA family ATPase [Vineibacter terrae]TXL70543.1 AAA family ATPase [Vineibacter terrae]